LGHDHHRRHDRRRDVLPTCRVGGGRFAASDPEKIVMSDNIIVATFAQPNDAYDAVNAIKQLRQRGDGDFRLKTGVMFKKDANGNLSLLEDRMRFPFGTTAGVAGGALIGLVGGAPGAAIGAAIGAAMGLSGDAVVEALDSDFVDTVKMNLKPGMTAVVFEANEGSTQPVDNIVSSSHGSVYRQAE
jgi:uncharacterized membrane protein